MAKRRMGKPSVTTYADHELIVPAHELKKAISPVPPGTPPDDPVGRAEAALAQLSTEFAAWMSEECDRLDRARKTIKTSGWTAASRDALFRASHDIKGEATTFGHPQAGRVAESLCRLIEYTPRPERIPLALIDQHVDAVRAMIREAKDKDADKTAGALAARLRQVTDEFLAHENRDRPDLLDELLSPPLAPNETF